MWDDFKTEFDKSLDNELIETGGRMKKERESGIELYKVIAIFLIVLSHVIQTLTEPNYVLGIGEGTFINIATATTDLDVLLLALFRICGALGNNMFFICSAWFLVNSKKT